MRTPAYNASITWRSTPGCFQLYRLRRIHDLSDLARPHQLCFASWICGQRP